MPDFPRLPVLGWSAFTGPGQAPVPGVLDARYQRHTISGRAAISLALQVLGISPGSKVLVPTYHCTTMIAPVVHADMQPMFYPLTARGAPDLEWLQRADLSGVHAMLAAHYFGLPQPMSSIRAFCDARRISLVEDCAHAYFGTSDGRPVGTWGDVAIASFTKFFPVSEGGLIASDTLAMDGLYLTPRTLHDEFKVAADAIEMGARHERFPGVNRLLNAVFALKRRLRRRPLQDTAAPASSAPAARARVPERLLASVETAWAVRWITATVHRSRIVALRRRNYGELARLLAGISGARVMTPELAQDAAPYVFPLYVDNPKASYQRLRAAGVPIFCWDELWVGTPRIPNDHGIDWATHMFQLGCHQDLSPDDIAVIAATVRDVIESPQKPPKTN